MSLFYLEGIIIQNPDTPTSQVDDWLWLGTTVENQINNLTESCPV